jgi:hypothetical protein
MRKVEADNLDLEAAFNSTGVVTVTKNTTQDIDFLVGEDLYLDGGTLPIQDGEFGDTIKAQVVDKDNILGYGAGFVVKTWIEKWTLCKMGTYAECELHTDYKGLVLNGLYLRIKYTSVSTTTDPKVAVNYLLHRLI